MNKPTKRASRAYEYKVFSTPAYIEFVAAHIEKFLNEVGREGYRYRSHNYKDKFLLVIAEREIPK